MARIEVFKTGLSLPMVSVHATGIAEGWEAAVIACWEHGGRIATQYDQVDDPISRDIFLDLVVSDPFVEPRVHRAFKDGITGLEAYRREVVEGLHDNWRDPEGGVGSYTYHERLFSYPYHRWVDPYHIDGLSWGGGCYESAKTNQIDSLVKELVRAPHTRRALAITWLPWADPLTPHPPCLQEIWLRVFGDKLVMKILIRSNDSWKAAFENMYAFTDLQRVIAERVSQGLGRTIVPGQYGHVAWSFHIYGSDFADFEGFLQNIEKRSWEDRTWRTDSPMFKELLVEADVQIARSLVHEWKTGAKGVYYCGCCQPDEKMTDENKWSGH